MGVENTDVFRSMALEILNVLNLHRDIEQALKAIIDVVQRRLGIEAIGIRLQEGNDYPYIAYEGFSDEHIIKENSLCTYNLDGQLMRDDVGNPVLDCMCGNIIHGRFDPSKPFFTEGGSFWTNSTTRLLDSTTEQDRMTQTRDTCNGEGYESVALIPIRYRGEVLGLIQLNDTRPDRFNLETIRFMENISSVIFLVLSEIKREKELKNSLKIYESVLDSVPYPIFIIDPDDFSIVKANVAAQKQNLSTTSGYERITCHEAIAGHSMPCEMYGEACPILEMLERQIRVKRVNLRALIGKDRTITFIEEAASPVWNEKEEIELAVLIVRDVTRIDDVHAP